MLNFKEKAIIYFKSTLYVTVFKRENGHYIILRKGNKHEYARSYHELIDILNNLSNENNGVDHISIDPPQKIPSTYRSMAKHFIR